MAYQRAFWKGQSVRHNGREDRIRGNPEAPPMRQGPGEQDTDMPDGADAPKKGSSQPKSGNPGSGELPMRHAHVKPKSRQRRQVLMAQALRHVPCGCAAWRADAADADGSGRRCNAASACRCPSAAAWNGCDACHAQRTDASRNAADATGADAWAAGVLTCPSRSGSFRMWPASSTVRDVSTCIGIDSRSCQGRK